MAWDTEAVLMLRIAINDMDSVSFTDTRLKQLLLVAARYVVVNTTPAKSYVINLTDLTLVPDPTDDTRDDNFLTLMVLKAICILAQSEARSAAKQSIALSDNFASINLGGLYASHSANAKNACEAYDEAVWQYSIGTLIPGRVIVSPYTLDGNSHGFGRGSARDGIY